MRRILCLGSALLILATAVPCDTVHVLQGGETLYSVARRFGVKLDDLLKDNGIDQSAVTKVRAGTKLTIRGVGATAETTATPRKVTVTHVVTRDETLWSISQRYGASVDEVKAANPGVDAGRLYVGAKLKVPVDADRAAAAPAPTPLSRTGTSAAEASSPGPTAERLWPHPGPREPSADGHFKYTKIVGKLGDPVAAVSSGRVTWVSPYRLYRNVVMIETRAAKTGDAYWFIYAGIDDVYVRAGDWVEKGAAIARVGANGSDGKGQVLFAVYQGTQVVDHTRTSWQ